MTDILDGLFKNILFHSIEELYLGDQTISYVTRLKLTGNLVGSLKLPAEDATIERFAAMNNLKSARRKLLGLLNEEASENAGLSIEIAGNR